MGTDKDSEKQLEFVIDIENESKEFLIILLENESIPEKQKEKIREELSRRGIEFRNGEMVYVFHFYDETLENLIKLQQFKFITEIKGKLNKELKFRLMDKDGKIRVKFDEKLGEGLHKVEIDGNIYAIGKQKGQMKVYKLKPLSMY